MLTLGLKVEMASERIVLGMRGVGEVRGSDGV